MGLDELIVSHRTCGRVDDYDGEYAETEFLCLTVLRLPLLPVRSFWIMADAPRRTSFQIQLHRRSVLAGYLRPWAPVVAGAMLVLSGSPLAFAVAVALCALWARSWTWLLRDPGELRRSSFDLAAFGSRCDPAVMTSAMRDALAHDLAARVAARSDSRPPDDVIRFGATTLDEALVTYGVLRLKDDPRHRAPARRLDVADQLLWSSFRRLRSQGAPYRDRLPDHDAFDLGSEISAAARARSGARLSATRAEAPPSAWRSSASPRTRSLALKVRILATVVTCVALGWYASWSPDPTAPASRPTTAARPPGPAPLINPGQLATRPLGRYGLVQCDYVQNSSQGPLEIVTLCGVGGRILAVAGGGVEGDASRVVRGRIERIPDGHARAQAWAMTLRHQIERDPSYYDFYLKRDGAEPQDHWAVVDDEARARELVDQRRATEASRARMRRLAPASTLVMLASWFVWLRLYGIRRRTRWLAALYKTAS